MKYTIIGTQKQDPLGLTVEKMRHAKKQSLKLAYIEYLRYIAHRDESALMRADRVYACSTVWMGKKCPVCGQLHGMYTQGCHHRLCPICAVRKARATAAQAQTCVTLLREKHPTARIMLLTLTQKSVPAEELGAEIDRLLEAWKHIRYAREVRRDMVAWARTIEVTVSSEGYHPHIHAIIMVSSESKLETQTEWRRLWAEVLGLDYVPICDIRPIADIGAVYEVSKYISKVSRLLDAPLGQAYDYIDTLSFATYRRHLRSYGGEWARMRKELSMHDAEEMSDTELDAVGAALDHDTCATCGGDLQPVCLIWSGMDYKER